MLTVDFRCPEDPRKLFARLRREGELPTITRDNLMEFGCRNCTHVAKAQDRSVRNVLHRFDFAGQLIESVVVFADGRPSPVPILHPIAEPSRALR